MNASRIVITAICLVAVGAAHGQKPDVDKKPVPKKQTVMQRKLSHAQKTLEGLAMADFTKVASGADGLMLCVQEASWKAVSTPKYEVYSNDMIRSLESMKKAAKAKNVDAAALAYVDLTLTCVKCHTYVREVKIGAVPDLKPFAFAGK
jgi:hypothetical protein